MGIITSVPLERGKYQFMSYLPPRICGSIQRDPQHERSNILQDASWKPLARHVPAFPLFLLWYSKLLCWSRDPYALQCFLKSGPGTTCTRITWGFSRRGLVKDSLGATQTFYARSPREKGLYSTEPPRCPWGILNLRTTVSINFWLWALASCPHLPLEEREGVSLIFGRSTWQYVPDTQ